MNRYLAFAFVLGLLIASTVATSIKSGYNITADVGANWTAVGATDSSLAGTARSANFRSTNGNIYITGAADPAIAPSVAINTTAGNLNGAFWYQVTFVSANGESAPSPSSAEVDPVNQQVDLSNIPVSPDPTVTARKIWRNKSGDSIAGPYYLAATIANNTATTLTDNATDGFLNTQPENHYLTSSLRTAGAIYENGKQVFRDLGVTLCIGQDAGPAITTGYNDVLIGFETGLLLTSGNYDTLLGRGAGSSLTTGAENTLVGAVSGQNLTGSRNTFVGSSAGRQATAMNNSIFVGAYAGYNQTAGNLLIIDSLNRGTLASETNNAPIYGTIDAAAANQRMVFNATIWVNGSLGIATNAPSEKLEVAGNIKASGGLSLAGTASMDSAKITNALTASSLGVGTVTFTNPPAPPSFLTAALPAASTGAEAWASDTLTPWGTGDLVFYDGSNWRSKQTRIIPTISPDQFVRNCLSVGWTGKTPIAIGFFSDFFYGNTALGDLPLASVVSGTGASLGINYTTSPEVPNAIALITGTDATGYSALRGPNVIFVDGENYVWSARVQLSALSDGTDKYWVLNGIDLGGSGTLGTDAAGFVYDPEDTLGFGGTAAQWKCVSRASSTNTEKDSGVAAGTSWVNLCMTYTTTNIVYYINSSAVATNTTNIPQYYLYSTRMVIAKTASTTSRSQNIDWIYCALRYAASRTLF